MNYQLRHSDFETREDFLYYIYNNLGCENLRIIHNYKDKDGEQAFSKWTLFGEIMQLPNLRKDDLIRRATHRTVLDIELMFDFDDAKLIRTNDVYEFKSIRAKAQWAYNKFKDKGFAPVVYWTQNKSYHMSVIVPWLRTVKPHIRRQMKENLLRNYGADVLKASENVPISLEGSIHYKSGKPKIEVQL